MRHSKATLLSLSLITLTHSNAYAFIGLAESISKGLFFAYYWPLLLAMGCILYALRITESIGANGSMERDHVSAKRFRFKMRIVWLSISVAALSFLYWADAWNKAVEIFEKGKDAL